MINIKCDYIVIRSGSKFIPDRPSPPRYVSIKRIESDLGAAIEIQINITWTAANIFGVDHNYTIQLDTHRAKTTQPYYITQLENINFASHCGEFLAYVIAVNGAGESDPSNNVTIPSQPDIGPVTASLIHHVWKSADGDIMVSVSFQVRHDNGLMVTTIIHVGLLVTVYSLFHHQIIILINFLGS